MRDREPSLCSLNRYVYLDVYELNYISICCFQYRRRFGAELAIRFASKRPFAYLFVHINIANVACTN
jgi:hypothetical protein